MGKVSKEFWVSDGFIEQMNKSVCELPGLTRSSFEYPIEKLNTGDKHSAHKITISYEIDQEVTIKESDLESAFKDISISGHSLIDLGVMDRVKKNLFGGEIK